MPPDADDVLCPVTAVADDADDDAAAAAAMMTDARSLGNSALDAALPAVVVMSNGSCEFRKLKNADNNVYDYQSKHNVIMFHIKTVNLK